MHLDSNANKVHRVVCCFPVNVGEACVCWDWIYFDFLTEHSNCRACFPYKITLVKTITLSGVSCGKKKWWATVLLAKHWIKNNKFLFSTATGRAQHGGQLFLHQDSTSEVLHQSVNILLALLKVSEKTQTFLCHLCWFLCYCTCCTI